MKTIINNALNILNTNERKILVKLIFLDFIVSVLDIFFLIALLYVVNFYTRVGDHKNSFLSAAIFRERPLLLISSFLILFSAKNYIAYLVFKSHYNFVYDVASRISKNKLKEYLQGDYHNYVEVDSSVHLHRINQQPIEFCHYVLKGLLQVSGQALLLLITLTAVLLYNAQVFLLLFIVLAPPIFIVTYILKKKLHASRTEAKSASERSFQHLQEALAGYVESKIYSKNDFFTTRYHTQQQKLNTYLSHQQIIQNIPPRLIEVFAIFGLFILIVITQFSLHTAQLKFITIGAFIAACYKIIPGIVKIINTVGQVKTYDYTCKDLIESKPNNTCTIPNQIATIHSFEISKVSFNYKNVQVLNSFSMKLKQGDFLGMCGTSGKGKTTLLNLLLGFISPMAGGIYFNDFKKMEAQLCWKKIAYVKQQSFLINDTIKTNIILNKDIEDDNKLLEVIQATGLNGIVEKTREGLDTVITEHGKNLSGGQRQRIALARALYKDFDLLILDEPCSELDEESEIFIMNYLKQLASNGKIIVLITHNKNALSFCNKTVSMDAYN